LKKTIKLRKKGGRFGGGFVGTGKGRGIRAGLNKLKKGKKKLSLRIRGIKFTSVDSFLEERARGSFE